MQAIVEQDNPYHSRAVRCGTCEGCRNARYYGQYVHEKCTGNNPHSRDCYTPVQVMVYPHKQNAVLINSNFRRVTELNQQLEAKLQAVSVQNTQLTSSLADMASRLEEDKKNITELRVELQSMNENLTQTRTDITGLTQMLNEVATKLQQLVRRATRAMVRMVAGDDHPEQELIDL